MILLTAVIFFHHILYFRYKFRNALRNIQTSSKLDYIFLKIHQPSLLFLVGVGFVISDSSDKFGVVVCVKYSTKIKQLYNYMVLVINRFFCGFTR